MRWKSKPWQPKNASSLPSIQKLLFVVNIQWVRKCRPLSLIKSNTTLLYHGLYTGLSHILTISNWLHLATACAANERILLHLQPGEGDNLIIYHLQPHNSGGREEQNGILRIQVDVTEQNTNICGMTKAIAVSYNLCLCPSSAAIRHWQWVVTIEQKTTVCLQLRSRYLLS